MVWSLPLEARGSRLRGCAASPARSIRSKCCPWCFRAENTPQPSLGFPSFVQKTLANVTNPWILPSVLDWLVVNFLKSRRFLTRCNIPRDWWHSSKHTQDKATNITDPEQLITFFLLLTLICDLYTWRCNLTWTIMLEHFFCVNSLLLSKLWVSQSSSPLQMSKALICAGFTARNSHHRHPIVLITFQKWNKKTVLNLCRLKSWVHASISAHASFICV